MKLPGDNTTMRMEHALFVHSLWADSNSETEVERGKYTKRG